MSILSLRARMRRKLAQVAAMKGLEDGETIPGVLEYAGALENACYERAIAQCMRELDRVYAKTAEFQRAYSHRVLRVLGALRSRRISPEDIDAPVEEISECAKFYQDQALNRLQAKVETKESQFSKCGRCFSSKVTYIPLTARAADEAMAYLYTCSDCKKQWRR